MKAQKYITKSSTTEDVFFLDGRTIGSLPQLIHFVSSKQYFGNLEYLKVVTATGSLRVFLPQRLSLIFQK